MKFNYYPETDSLYIEFNAKASSDSKEVSDGVVIDFDEKGDIVGIDIDNASKIIDLQKLESNSLPTRQLILT